MIEVLGNTYRVSDNGMNNRRELLAAACLMLLATACAGTSPAAPAPLAAVTPAKPGATALLLVMRAGVPGAEHVETERLLLLSRSFKQSLQAASGVDGAAEYDVIREGTSELLRVHVRAETAQRALDTCKAISSVATTSNPGHSDTGAQQWLRSQIDEMTRSLAEREAALHELRANHGSLAVSLEDQLAMQRDLLRDVTLRLRKSGAQSAERKQLEGTLRELEREALQLDLRATEEQRLVREVEMARVLLQQVMQRSTTTTLDALLDPRLRVVDECSTTSTNPSSID